MNKILKNKTKKGCGKEYFRDGLWNFCGENGWCSECSKEKKK